MLYEVITALVVEHAEGDVLEGIGQQVVETTVITSYSIHYTKLYETLTGDRLAQPGNAWVRIGTSVRWLMQRFGLDPEPGQRVIMGGPMMGFTLPHADVVITSYSIHYTKLYESTASTPWW